MSFFFLVIFLLYFRNHDRNSSAADEKNAWKSEMGVIVLVLEEHN